MSNFYRPVFKSAKHGIITHNEGSMQAAFHDAHETIARYCEYCGRPMSRSDVNDHGSLCENCYRKEYGYED